MEPGRAESGAVVADEPVQDAASAVRAEVRRWLEERWDPERAVSEWIEMVVDSGWACPSWPKEWHGRGLTLDLSRVVAHEFAQMGAPGTGQDVMSLAGNAIVAFGTDELKRQLLRPLLTGELRTCLLYSEPGAGSDLAGLQTRAVRDGDEWVVNGQKVWTSGAMEADYGLLVARTDSDVPKHQGITFFVFPMRQSGVEIRPIRQINRRAEFNEVFFTDARVPHANVIGTVNDGWRVLQTALAYERMMMGGALGAPVLLARGDLAAGRAAAAAETERVSATPSTGMDGHDDLIELARQTGAAADPAVRQELAYVYSLRMVGRWTGDRAAIDVKLGGSSPAASVGKLAQSRLLHRTAKLKHRMLGAEAMLDGPDAPRAEAANLAALNAYVTSIGGGTDQIQRNILGERVLGLPKEPAVDRDVAFKDVLKSPATRRFG